MADRAGSGVPLTFSTRQQLKRGMNLVLGLYYVISAFPEIPVALNRVGSHCCESRFGRVRGILRGHNQQRFWYSADAAVSVMDEIIADLSLEPRARGHRIAEAGARCPVERPWVCPAESRRGAPERPALRPFAVEDDAGRTLAALRVGAVGFAMAHEGMGALFEAYMTNLNEWLDASAQRLTPGPADVLEGPASQARFVMISRFGSTDV
jgi:hypothetical protein